MDKLHVGLVGAALVAAVVAWRAVVLGSAWESRARTAEQHAAALRESMDSLVFVALAAEAASAHTDTVRVTLTKLIPQTDAATRPDSTCAKSLAARDTVLATSAAEIDELQRAFRAEVAATARLQAAYDTVAAALRARPSTATFAVENLLHPTLHLALQAMVYPAPRIGVGVSLDLVRIRL